jgi:hypothetical protein
VEDADKASELLLGAGVSLLHASEVYQPDAV